MKAVVLAGGEGTRLRPLTSTRPKPLMPVADRPCIDYILRSLVTSGVKDFIIAIHYLSDRLIRAIGDGMGYNASIVYSFEEKPAGTAGAVRRVQSYLDETFVVTMGDIVADVEIAPLLEFHRARRSAATIALTEVDDPSQYGVAAINEKGRIQRFLEKPKRGEAFSNLVNAGIYILERRVIDFVPDDRMFDFSRDLFPLLLSKGVPVYGAVLKGTWLDIGRPADLLRASLVMVDKYGSEMKVKGAETSGKILLKDNVKFGSGSRLEGPCYVGMNVRIGERAAVRASCLQSDVTVGAGVRLSGTQVLEGATIGPGSNISDSVIAEDCEVGSDVKMTESVIGSGIAVKSGASLRGVTLP